MLDRRANRSTAVSRSECKAELAKVYSVAAATATGLTACHADAAVRYSGPQNLEIAQFNAQDLSIDSDPYADILLKNYVFGGGNYQGATVSFAPGRLVAFQSGPLFYATALAAGELIDATTVSSSFVGSLAYGPINPSAQFNTADGAFIGLSFPIGGALPENLHYGWVRVTIDNAAGTFVINDWAYNDEPGAPILAGEVAQPIPGDFSDNGRVNLLDYTIWRDNLGADESTGVLNGNGTGDTVDQADYALWKQNFGRSTFTGDPPPLRSAAGLQSSQLVPEPGALGLLAAGSLGLTLLRRRHESRGE